MAGFGFNNDELSKLFAEAEGAVKKVKSTPSTPPPAPAGDLLDDPAFSAKPAAPKPLDPGLDAPPARKGLAWDEDVPPARKALAWDEDVAPAKKAVAWDEEVPPAKKVVAWDADVPAAPPARKAAAWDDDWAKDETPARPAAPAPQPAAATPPATGSRTRLVGGEQADDALNARGEDGSTVRIPWSGIRALTVGRVGERLTLAFVHGGMTYFFSDDNVAYKGLLRNMQATLAMNWRSLVNEIAERVSDRSDPGVAAMTGAGGMVPRFMDMAEFMKAVSAKG